MSTVKSSILSYGQIPAFASEPKKVPSETIAPVIRDMVVSAFAEEFPDWQLESNSTSSIDFFDGGADVIPFEILAFDGKSGFQNFRGMVTADEIVFFYEE